MARFFVSSSGSNTAPYDTWAKAATSLQTALTAATGAGDIVALDVAGVPSGDAEHAGNTTYTFAGNIALVCSTNSGTSTITPTAMGATSWVGNSTTAQTLAFAGAFKVYIFGLTMSGSGSVNLIHTINTTDGGDFVLESCRALYQSTVGSYRVQFGNATNQYIETTNFVYDNNRDVDSNSFLAFGCKSYHVGFFADMLGGIGTNSFMYDLNLTSAAASSVDVTFVGGNFESVGSTATLVGACSRSPSDFRFVQCRMPAGIAMLASQSPANRSAAHVWLNDCHSGDVHTQFEYHNAFGSVVSDTGIYLTAGAAAQSWKITTTANCSFYTPFQTPWIDWYNETMSAQAPYIEILRDGSATAYKDDQAWIDVMAKVTSGSVQSSISTDRMTLLGTPANQAAGAGTGSWTGASGTAWSGKCAVASLTPVENGHIRARIAVGEPSITVYADPQIRV